ncbi:Oidioi.mRNA.OKI2018_I69.PAR.g11739.t1.cds [Oikopleura dioica]|uniref:[histone H3]-lysine(4) N-trimethyltransferase n=1 Tax=Oikopleura dioica TaxID=34765 RepID=A0ABN7S1V0_OIKDI|nr:Oidioi.mRNA.OKI2018_I69.PAR.g11739.t1.cds [Oikopleura dioica]
MNILNSSPYVHTLAKKYHGLRCAQCTVSKPKLSRCAGCKLQYYCSKDCQKSAWKWHKEECKMLKSEKSIPDDITMFLGRILLRIESEFGDGEEPSAKLDTLIHVLQLESHYDRLDPSQQEDLGIFLMKFTRYWKKPIPRGVLGSRKLLDLVAAIKNNQFAICDEEASNCDIGSALYLDQSLLNHSCKPNAFPVFNGTNLIIKALEKIAPGEEIKIAYTDTKAVTADRREYLNSIYRFICACPGCTNGHEADSKKLEDNKGNVMKPSTPLWQSAETMISDMEEFKTKKEWTLMNEAAKGWLARKMFPEENIYWIRLQEYAFDAGIETQDWSLCLSTGASLIISYKELYGSMHPTLGLHLMKFAKILLHIEKPNEAEEYFRRAFGIISLFYEPDSTVRKHLLELIMEAYELAQVQEDKAAEEQKKKDRPVGPDGKPKLKNLFAELKANGQI